MAQRMAVQQTGQRTAHRKQQQQQQQLKTSLHCLTHPGQ
jgi:hypothetical protein